MARANILGGLLLLALAGAAVFTHHLTADEPVRTAVVFADNGGRPVKQLEAGSSLFVGAQGLMPNTTYEFRLAVGREEAPSREKAVTFARGGSDAKGNIRPFVLWYESGVVGCSERVKSGTKLPPFCFRTFEEGEKMLADKTVTVSVHPVQKDPTGKTPPMKLSVEKSAATGRLQVARRQSPMVYPSDAEGCLVNSRMVGKADTYVSGRSFPPGQRLEICVVPNQRTWRVGNPINDVTGVNGADAAELVEADRSGRFRVKVWDAKIQQRGTYDIVAHVADAQPGGVRRVGRNDIISYLSETGYVLYLRYPVGGPTMDIAGRPLTGSPYFQFADSFAQNEDVWGAVDPTYVPATHPGGRYAAYYVVPHRGVSGWDPSAGGSIDLIDVSGGIEIMPVKAGCVNGTDVIIWHGPLPLGEYDVVVDFGLSPAETAPAYSSDGQYNEAVDFLDGADQVGFTVVKDPYELGPMPIGRAEYSQDDFFPTLGGATDVDLRAVVRYPATAPGDNMPVAAGAHPLFVIEHGNHQFCEVNATQTHASCPNRTPNHKGYMRLLEILASHGIIAVSIDAYDLTGSVPGWIEERGDLILKHLELWSHLNDPATFSAYPDFFGGRFKSHVDMTKIAVSGHSRGGEASVAAFMRNTSFNIKAVSSIAPVDFEAYILPDVPYFVILPAADGDVSDLSGAHIYDRAGNGTAPPNATIKSGIHVYGANHNFFNTVWADDWDDSSATRDDFIAKADQQRLGEAYLAAFTRIHLNNETVYEDMLRGRLTFPSTAGFKIHHFRHEKSHAALETGAGVGGVAAGMTKTSVTNPSVHRTQAIRLGWSGSGGTLTYAVPAAQQNVSAFEVFSLRAAQTNSASNPASGSQDFQIELVGNGKTKAVYATRFDQIPKPYRHPYGSPRNVMTTVRIPLQSFIMNKSGVPLDHIDTLRLRFTSPTQGEIYVDDVEFSR